MNFKFKKFFSYYKPYVGLFTKVMLCALIVAGITLVYPLLSRHVTKTILQEQTGNVFKKLILIGILMLGLVLIQLICNYYVDYKGHAMGAMMERDMRNELFDHYQRLSFRFYDEQKTGKLLTRITNDLLSLAEFYHHAPEDYVIYSIKFIGTFIILLTIDAKLTLVVFVTLPVMAVFSLYFNKKLRNIYKANYEIIGDINSQVEDNLSGIRVVKSFGNEEFEKRKFSHENDRFLESRKGIYKNEAYLYNGMDAFTQLITVAVIIFGGANIIHSTLDLADMITFLLFTGNIIEPIRVLNRVAGQFREGITCFERFMELMAVEPDITISDHALEPDNILGNITFKNVAFKYREDLDYVLENISLEVQTGDNIAIVGASGIGKSTLCSLIPRFYDVSKGEILLDGINIKDMKLSSVRNNIGVVQQDVYLFSGTILDNIRYGKLDASFEEIVEASKSANAHDFIMKLPDGYHTDIGQRGVKLSGGQKQRLSIARVFLKNPPILIFDEATSALDNDSERIVKETFDKLVKNRTTFVIAHRLSTIRNAKKILVLSEKGIIEQGTHDELMALSGAYSNLYKMQ